MKRVTLSISLVIISSVTLTQPAFAYLDPGTGSIILQGIIGTVAAASAAIGLYWNQVKIYFKSLTGNADQDKAPTHRDVAE